MENRIIQGDSLEKLKEIPDESVDLLCTDPPYGYSFMGKSWDKTLPDIGVFREAFRVLKPGAFAFIMSAPRSDVCARMMLMLEDAGFEIGFTPIYWTYASGFPKAMNIGKMVDKREGYERETLPTLPMQEATEVGAISKNRRCAICKKAISSGNPCQCDRSTKPITDAAKALDGSYGNFSPKPAVEVVIVAQKPRTEKTSVDQALAWLSERNEVLRSIADAVKEQYNQDVIWDEEAQYHPKSA